MALLLKILVVVAALAALVLLGSQAIQRRLTYYPDPARTPPRAAGLPGAEEVPLKTPDGETVVCWWVPAKPGRQTLLYFHGNAGSLATRVERLQRYAGRGYGVFIMSYRGYSGSTGQPSERANVADARLAYDALRTRGVEAEEIVLYGESLGTGVAVQVAGDKPVAGVILDAPYTSLVDVGELHYPHLPARLLMTDRYDSRRHIARVTVPLLIVHGSEDRIIPAELGRRLYQAAPGPKTFALIRGAGHTDHAMFGSMDTIFPWLERLSPLLR